MADYSVNLESTHRNNLFENGRLNVVSSCFTLRFWDLYCSQSFGNTVFAKDFGLFSFSFLKWQSITKAYGRVDADGSRYLLSDHAGMLHLLVITHDKERLLILPARSISLNSLC